MEKVLSHSQNPNHLEVTVTGRIDSATAPDFYEAIDQDQKDKVTDIIVDFTNVDYISAAGLRALVAINRRCANHQNRLELVGCQPRVVDTLHLVGFDTLFPRFDSINDARKALGQRN